MYILLGMRSNSHVLVFIDLSKALDGITVNQLTLGVSHIFIYIIVDGLQFFRSANDVILSPGNKDGLILPQYFKKVTEL